MVRIFKLFLILVLSSVYSFSQNILNNHSFEEGNYNVDVAHGAYPLAAYLFKHKIDAWKGRMKNMDYRYSEAWHSPDWKLYGNQDGPKYVGMRGYELVQQQLQTNLIPSAFYKIKFSYGWDAYSDNVKLQFYLSQDELKYKKERLFFLQKENKHLCSEDYKNFTAEVGTDYFVVAEIDNLIYQQGTTGLWYTYEEIIQVPDDGTFSWFGFQLVLKPEYTGEGCLAGNLRIDDVELELVRCSNDLCGSTDGAIDIKSFTHPEYGHCFCNLNNVRKVENFRVINFLNQSSVYIRQDIECINGIKDTICWNGKNNYGATVASAGYFVLFDATNDCGTYNYSKDIYHPQGTNYITKTSYPCNNSVELPVDCCGHEPDIYIANANFTGEGYVDIIAQNSIISEDFSVDESVDLVHFQAGEEIEITNAVIDGNFVAEIKSCEPVFNYSSLPETSSPLYLIDDFTEYDKNEGIKNITPQEYQDFFIYPNPVTEVLYVNTNLACNIDYRITDFDGRILTKGCKLSSFEIDMSFIKPGFYILSLKYETKLLNYKIIKQ